MAPSRDSALAREHSAYVDLVTLRTAEGTLRGRFLTGVMNPACRHALAVRLPDDAAMAGRYWTAIRDVLPGYVWRRIDGELTPQLELELEDLAYAAARAGWRPAQLADRIGRLPDDGAPLVDAIERLLGGLLLNDESPTARYERTHAARTPGAHLVHDDESAERAKYWIGQIRHKLNRRTSRRDEPRARRDNDPPGCESCGREVEHEMLDQNVAICRRCAEILSCAMNKNSVVDNDHGATRIVPASRTERHAS